jgi:ubiquinone/menaquinone biosynthesis C-methylase UbiE
MKTHRLQNNLEFQLTAFWLSLRDLIRPPFKILKNIGLESGMTVLDYGCGPGSFALAAARIVGPQGKVYAVDIHPASLALMHRKAQNEKYRHLVPLLPEELAWIPNPFADLVILNDVLHALPDPTEVLAMIHRALKPSGFLTVNDHHLAGWDLFSAVFSSGFFEFKHAWPGLKTIKSFRKKWHE